MTFRRALGPFDATMMVVGGIIGAGIFVTPAIVAQRVDSPALVLAAWTVGGTVALSGALAYGELAALFPRAGGQYIYLSEAFHPLAGFLYGWALLLIIGTGALAAVAITFAEYALRLVGRADGPVSALAVCAIAVVSAINYCGVVPGSRFVNLFSVLKITALLILIGGAFLAPDSALSAGPAEDGPRAGIVAFGTALVPVLFAYGGWQQTNFITEEIERPQRTLPFSLAAGTAIVVAVYLLVTITCLRILGYESLAASAAPAADVASRLFGPGGNRFVAAAIAISTFGFLNVAVLAPTRVYYALAADGYLPSAMARLHVRFRTPSSALIVQAIWTIVLLITGTYGQLLDYVVFADWIFFGLTVAALFVFRRRLPTTTRPAGMFVAPGYPVLPAFFVAVSAAVVMSVVWTNPQRSAAGAMLLAAGLPVFWYYSKRATRRVIAKGVP